MNERYLITHSLLSSWLYAIKNSPYESKRDPFDDFLTSLRRESIETTSAMQRGIDFENLVTQIVNGETSSVAVSTTKDGQQCLLGAESLSEHEWYRAASKVADVVRGGSLQHRSRKVLTIAGMDVVLYGRLDALKAGTIYDIKFSSRYERGKFLDSTQHPVYLELVPEASQFVYLVSDGLTVWSETYRRYETVDIKPIIEDFFVWLCDNKLMDIYVKHWGAF